MPSSSIATSFRTEKETIDRLDALASSLGRSRNWLVNEAVSDYLAYNEWLVEKVREGDAVVSSFLCQVFLSGMPTVHRNCMPSWPL